MAKKPHEVPNLENATPAFLLDEIAKMRVETSRLKFLDGVYKQALEARITPAVLEGRDVVEGEKFFGQRKKMTQERISAEKVRAYFEKRNDPEGLKECMELTEFWQWNTTAKV